jgi:diguanylate cyclase (GGDEF)-like protein
VLIGTDIATAQRLANRIRTRVAQACGLATAIEGINVTASFGVSSIALGAVSPAAMVDQADQALYVAKQLGRNRVENFSAMAEVVV